MTVQPHERKNGASKTAVHQMSEKKALPEESLFGEACPFLGLADDPSTRLLFVSPAGCCHRAEPVANVDLEHQNSYCLTAQHILCPVFVRPEWDPLPPDLAYHHPEVRTRRIWLWGFLGLVVIVVLIG